MKVQKVQRVSNVWQNSWLKIDRKSERLWGWKNSFDQLSLQGIDGPTNLERCELRQVGLGAQSFCKSGQRRWPRCKQLDQSSASLIRVKPHQTNCKEIPSHIQGGYLFSCVHQKLTLRDKKKKKACNNKHAWIQMCRHVDTIACQDMHTCTAEKIHRSIALSRIVTGRSGMRRDKGGPELPEGFSPYNTSGNFQRKPKLTILIASFLKPEIPGIKIR